MFVRIAIVSTLCLVFPFVYGKISPFRLGKCTNYTNFEKPVQISTPYTFLAEGTQAYVFLSKDQRRVLKLFKNRNDVEKILDAYTLALEIPELTGVICIGRLPSIDVKDKWGRVHHVEPGHVPFILQKKAAPFFRTIRNAPIEKRGDLLQSFYSLLKEMDRLGIANLDNSLGRNYGFIEGKAVIIDFGKCAYAPDLTKEREAHMIRRLNKWLQKNQ